MQTEFEFELPKGYVDQNGDLHKRGTMRLATAADEILPLRDPRVQQNSGYLTIILLSRVITKLGTLSTVNTRVIENLFTMDLAYLQDMYQRINMSELPHYQLTCPHCNQLPRRRRGERPGRLAGAAPPPGQSPVPEVRPGDVALSPGAPLPGDGVSGLLSALVRWGSDGSGPLGAASLVPGGISHQQKAQRRQPEEHRVSLRREVSS